MGMTDTTTHATGTGGDGGGVKDAAQDRARQVADQAQQVAGQAKGTLREQVDQRSRDAGSRVSATAQDVRSVGDELRKQGKEGPAKLADRAAERAEHLGGYLEDTSGEQLLQDLEDAARKNPWAVVLGGLAVGFAASRVLKASSSERYASRQGTGSPREPRPLPPSPPVARTPRAPVAPPPPPVTTPPIPAPTGGAL
jgi:hypothetical protein